MAAQDPARRALPLAEREGQAVPSVPSHEFREHLFFVAGDKHAGEAGEAKATGGVNPMQPVDDAVVLAGNDDGRPLTIQLHQAPDVVNIDAGRPPRGTEAEIVEADHAAHAPVHE